MPESATVRAGGADPLRVRQLDHRHRPRLLARRVSWRVWIVLAVALALRVALVGLTFDTPTNLDPADFSRTAQSIAQGHGYPQTNRAPGGGPSAFRPPAYPVLLAGVYAVAGGEEPAIGRLTGACLGTVTVALIGLIALRLWGRRVGMVALGIAALAPPLVVMSTALVSEALFIPLVLGAVAAAVEASRSRRPLRWAVVAGVLTGIAALTRTNGLLLLLPLALALVRPRERRLRWALAGPAVAVSAALLTITPWTARNWLVLHRFVPVSTEIGYTLAGTYNAASRNDSRWPAVWKEAEHGASSEYGAILFSAEIHRWGEVTYGNHLQSAAIADIRRDPWYVPEVGYWNFVRMFHLGELDFATANLRDTDIPPVPALLEIYGYYPLAILALAGLLTRQARRTPMWLWLVPVCLATTVFVTGFIRFRAPIDPFFVMLAALAVNALAQRPARHRDQAHHDDDDQKSVPGVLDAVTPRTSWRRLRRALAPEI